MVPIKHWLFFIFPLFAFSAFSQSKHILRPPANEAEGRAMNKLAQHNSGCVHRNTYTAARRLKFYPFNKAVQVKLVSFCEPDHYKPIHDTTARNMETPVKHWQYPFYVDHIDTSQFIQTKLLNKKQIDELTDILYNFGVRSIYPYVIHQQYSCYEPRNAIVFVNAKGKIFSHVKICFECLQIRTSSEKLNIGNYCTEKLSMLKSLFAKEGVRYGVDATYTENFDNTKL